MGGGPDRDKTTCCNLTSSAPDDGRSTRNMSS